MITPAERIGSTWKLFQDHLTVGDVLDTRPPLKCWVRKRWYSDPKKRVGIVVVSCGKRSCPLCVVNDVAAFAAPAWAYWRSRAVTVEVSDEDVWVSYRRQWKIKVRGPDADPGVLVVPISETGERIAFLPDPSGSNVDVELVAALRAMPVVTPKTVKRDGPDPAHGFIQPHVSDDQIRDAAASAGFEVQRFGRNWRAVEDVTPEMNDRWIAGLK